MNWVSRILSVALMTLLPILGGRWLDGKRATSHWALIGLVVGLLVGFYQLMQIVREANKAQQRKTSRAKPTSDEVRTPPRSAAGTPDVRDKSEDGQAGDGKSSGRGT